MVAFKLNRPGPQVKSAPSRSPRRRVLIDGSFQSLTATYPVAVRNLSCTGALVESKVPLKIGGHGVLATRHLDRFCSVIWSRGTLHGLSFDEPLHPQVVVDIHRITAQDLKQAETEAAKEWFQNGTRLS